MLEIRGLAALTITAAAFAAAVSSPATSAAVPDKATSARWGHIKVLASDDFQGRLTGSPRYS